MKTTSNSNELVLIIIHSSIGELQWILPFMYYLKEVGGYDLATTFFSSKVKDNIEKERIYYSLLTEVSQVVEKRDLFTFLLKGRKHVKYIFKDFWPIHPGSLASSIRNVCPQASLILYPHSFALYGYEKTHNQYQHAPESHHKDCYDGLVVNTAYDVSYWSKTIVHERIRVVGALGYAKEWIDKLVKRASELTESKKAEQASIPKFKALFAIRGPKPILLEEEDYNFLMSTALNELFSRDDLFIYLKPHPRQDLDALKVLLKPFPENRFTIVYENPFVLGEKVDFAVNFWTSVTTDLLALGKPSIEYYVFKGDYAKWLTLENGKKTSYYDHLELTKSVNTQEDLSKALEEMVVNLSAVSEYRTQRFNEIFTDNSDAGKRMLEFMRGMRRNVDSTSLRTRLTSYLHIFISSMKSVMK